MLSWLIDHVPIERKYLAYLLKNCDKLSKYAIMLSSLLYYLILNQNIFVQFIVDVDVDEEIALCMSSITEGLCSPLVSRVESILHMNENPIDLYGVASSLKFYLQIVIKVSLQINQK